MGILDFDPSKFSLGDAGTTMGKIISMGTILLWAFILIFALIFFIRYLQYRIPVEIFEKRGLTPVIIGSKKAKKIINKDGTEEWELLEKPIGVFMGRFRRQFRIDNNDFIFPTNKGFAFKLEKTAETYQPIKITNPNMALERVPQNNLWWLSNKILRINEKYTDKKWFEPYIMPLSIVVVAIICFLMIVLTLDKVSGIQEFCSQAEKSLGSKLVQNIN